MKHFILPLLLMAPKYRDPGMNFLYTKWPNRTGKNMVFNFVVWSLRKEKKKRKKRKAFGMNVSISIKPIKKLQKNDVMTENPRKRFPEGNRHRSKSRYMEVISSTSMYFIIHWIDLMWVTFLSQCLTFCYNFQFKLKVNSK